MDQLNPRESRVQAVVASLDLEKLSWNDQPWPDELELGLLQLESRSLRLQGVVLEVFVRAIMEEFDSDATDTEKKKYFDKALSDKIVRLTRHVLRNHLKHDAPFSLNKLAAKVLDEKKPGFRKASNELIKKTQEPMEETGLWKIEVLVRKDKRIQGYKISAGQTLIDWEQYVWRPMRLRQIQQFNKKYGGQI